MLRILGFFTDLFEDTRSNFVSSYLRFLVHPKCTNKSSKNMEKGVSKHEKRVSRSPPGPLWDLPGPLLVTMAGKVEKSRMLGEPRSANMVVFPKQK